MFCVNCGNKIEDGDKFCTNCGTPINSSDITGENATGSNNNVGHEDLSIQINNAKCVKEYSEDTTVEGFDTVKFGSYPQSDATGNKKDPIEWIVLEKGNGKALLLSKYILDCKCYNNVYAEISWEKCDLRKWLNNSFLNTAFSKNEQEKIAKIIIKNNDNPKFKDGKGGEDTEDKVFLLSIEECMKYLDGIKDETNVDLKINKHLLTIGTKYAKEVDNNGEKLSIYGGDDDGYECSCFYLRTPGMYNFEVCEVSSIGDLDLSGSHVDFIDGVRPALWVTY